MDNAIQSRTHFVEDNTVTDSGLTKKEEKMIEDIGSRQ